MEENLNLLQPLWHMYDIICNMGNFDLEHVRVILGSISALISIGPKHTTLCNGTVVRCSTEYKKSQQPNVALSVKVESAAPGSTDVFLSCYFIMYLKLWDAT